MTDLNISEGPSTDGPSPVVPTCRNGHRGQGGRRLYRALRAGDEPPDAYGVLCWNCQTIREYERRAAAGEEQER